MVKFSKDLEAQLIPEWKDAFVNYWQLKKHVKKIKLSRKSPKQTQDPNGDFGLSIFDPIHFVVNKISNCLRNTGDKPEIIQVKSKVTEREDDEEVGEVYETELSQLFSEEDEVKLFFERLDEELNKVNQFYKTKESEFLRKGEILNKKLQTLLEGKQILSDRCRKSLSPAGFFPPSYSSSARNSDYSENPTEYNESLKEPSQMDDATASPTKTKKENSKMGMRVDIPPTTPTWAISSVTSMLREDIVLKNPKKKGQGDLITRKKTQCDKKMIRGTFVELYKGLGLLKTYRLI